MYARDTTTGRIVYVCGKPVKRLPLVLVVFGQKNSKPYIQNPGAYKAYLIDEDRLEELEDKALPKPSPTKPKRRDTVRLKLDDDDDQ